MHRSKEPIRLRNRKMESGLISLYLDIYIDGQRSYEYLKLYLVPEKSRSDKEKNKITLQLAEDIKAKRMVELRNGQFGFRQKYKEETLFYNYYMSMCEDSLGEDSKGNWGNWYSCLHHLKLYDGKENLTFRDITPEWIQGFKDYLDKEAVAWAHDTRKRSDIYKLTWGEVHQQGNYVRLIFKQKKTGGQEYLDISPQAVEHLPIHLFGVDGGGILLSEQIVLKGYYPSLPVVACFRASHGFGAGYGDSPHLAPRCLLRFCTARSGLGH